MILITGDIHGSHDISKLDNTKNPIFKKLTKEDYLIICGDFGLVWYNDMADTLWRTWLDEKPFTTLFVDGNHENFDLLYEFPEEEWHGGRVHKISDSILHLMRGQLFDLQGKSFFTMGGAESHDKAHRTLDRSIWLQELPSDEEYANALTTLEKCNYNVDYVITHCAPTDIQNEIAEVKQNFTYTDNRLTKFFSDIEPKLQYKRWFCGHYHRNYVSQISPNFEILFNKIVKLP